MIDCLIFSSDRAMQLDLLLRSMEKKFFNINIIYKSSNDKFERGYDKLIKENSINNINWVKEKNFKKNVLEVLQNSKNEYFCFFTDDDVFFEKLNIEKVEKQMNNDDIFCFSLRLGENTKKCYTMNTTNVLIPLKKEKNIITYLTV